MQTKSGKYTDEDLRKAKELAELLQSFSNKDLACVINRKVTNSSRTMVIAEILVKEFGQAILNKRVIKLFGEDTVTQKYVKR